ncbi:MAG TPA: hypothetical protein VGZ02_06475 [Candidatus Baltobacteraceae bacterium]|jgi:hypothetical protein|nr:hypothetical protein [Candidatus Baltobacteraceae bacterium]
MRDVLKFDTMIAALALLMSSVTAGAMLYQTHVVEEQFAATVWPYLSVVTTFNPHSVKIQLVNDGAGPALIRSAQLYVDGAPAPGWGVLVNAVAKDLPRTKHGSTSTSMSDLDASVAIRPGEEHTVVAVSSTNATVMTAARKHRVTMHLCYCSINERCWKLDAYIGTNSVDVPQPIDRCTSRAQIASS